MVNYNLIKNEKLRALLRTSESVHSLSEVEQQQMVEQISYMPPGSEAGLIQVFEEEQQKIVAAKRVKVKAINHEYTLAVNKAHETSEREESDQKAKNILNEL